MLTLCAILKRDHVETTKQVNGTGKPKRGLAMALDDIVAKIRQKTAYATGFHARALFDGAVPDNQLRNLLTHCLSWVNCCFGEGVLKRHSHSFKNSPKLFFGTPLNLRK